MFYICLIVYLYGDLAIYAAAVPISLMEVACGNHSCSAGSVKYNDTDPCWGPVTRKDAYRVFLCLFSTVCSVRPLQSALIQKPHTLPGPLAPLSLPASPSPLPPLSSSTFPCLPLSSASPVFLCLPLPPPLLYPPVFLYLPLPPPLLYPPVFLYLPLPPPISPLFSASPSSPFLSPVSPPLPCPPCLPWALSPAPSPLEH
uniref:Uncharacterized protein n=1 Tax=Knipowitschia caucasica TaxID=637954 RepID=A0AAV2KBP7_KNICA